MILQEGVHYAVREDGCWVWLGYADKGAGLIGSRRAHRVAYEQFVGSLAPDVDVVHTCPNPLCINPEHLRAQTHSQTMRESTRAARSRFTEADVATIRRRAREGESDDEIAAAYGVHRTTIGRLARGARWAEVGGPVGREDAYCLECGVLLTNRRGARFCSQRHSGVYSNRKRKGMKKRITYPVLNGVWLDPDTDPRRFGYKGQPASGTAEAESPEVEAVLDAIAEVVGKPSATGNLARKRPARLLTAAERKAVEMHAMDLAQAHFESCGWTMLDVSAQMSFDFLATQTGQPDKMVEVKGTTTKGEKVVLTRNEVANALRAYPNVALFVVHEISLYSDGDMPVVEGGTARVYDPWRLNQADLEPLSYSYLVPDFGEQDATAPEQELRQAER